MLVAAGVLPHPPLLVPELGRGDEPVLDELRRRCRQVVDTVTSIAADRLYLVGADLGLRATSLRPWGAPVEVDVPEPLPVALLVAAWLTVGRNRSFVVVDPQLAPDECAEIGSDLADSADRVALLVMGDGAARHGVKAPGYVDERSAPYDERVAAALRTGDATALRALDPAESEALMVAGRAPWQVLAGAADGFRPAATEAWFTAPYGVGYHVACWT